MKITSAVYVGPDIVLSEVKFKDLTRRAMPQNQQYNRPPQQQKTVPQTAPGSPATKVTEPEVAEQEPEGTTVRELTFEEHFKFMLAQSIGEIWIGTKTPHQVKLELQLWWDNLTTEEKTEYKYILIETGKHLYRQAEEIVIELPVLFM